MSFVIRVVKHEGPWTPKQKDRFRAATERWTRIIAARDSGKFSGTGADGLDITAKIGRLDRKGGLSANTEVDFDSLLGSAAGRAEHLPTKATIILDKTDVDAMDEAEPEDSPVNTDNQITVNTARRFLDDLMAHEIGHALGLTWPIWERKRLLDRHPDTDRPLFVGPAAKKAFGAALGEPPKGIPLEIFGDGDEFLSHWREAQFGSELMTCHLEDSGNQISVITVGALQDLGYEVHQTLAETKELNLPDGTSLTPSGRLAAARPSDLRHRLLRENRVMRCHRRVLG
jgi:hypothetical protein